MADVPVNYEIYAEANKTHLSLFPELEIAKNQLLERFLAAGGSKDTDADEVRKILDDLGNSELGRHILMAGGSNGHWTDYMISPEANGKHPTDPSLTRMERFFLFESPAVLAQRELQQTLQKVAQSQVVDGKVFASIPCGLMRDFLSLDYSGVNSISLVGIDLDPDSIERSKQLAQEKGIDFVTYHQENAWQLQHENEFDFLSSIGLNMYVSDREEVIALYRNFHKALKPGCMLFTGFLTWPPYMTKEKTDWDMSAIAQETLRMESVVHRDVLNIQWLNCRTLEEALDDYKAAGFSDVRIIKDSKSIFPAIIAIK